jgi:DNA-binding transcriptional MerR regulator
VRYYVQEGLLPPPLGVGRGRHYDRLHLDRLLRVKTLQEQGLSLEEVRATLSGGTLPARASVPSPPAVGRSAWTRLELTPGVELHVSSDWRLPSPGRIDELAHWVARHLRRAGEGSDE